MFNERRPGPDYTLRWPPELFIAELQRLRSGYERQTATDDDIEWLLTEAFVSDKPAADYRLVKASGTGSWPNKDRDIWSTEALGPQRRKFVERLIDAAPRFEQEVAPRPYFVARSTSTIGASTTAASDDLGARRNWALVVRRFQQRGYLDRVAPAWCVDGGDDQVEPDAALEAAIAERLGTRSFDQQYWPLDPATWNDDTFYSLVEVIHDLVARPQSRTFHSYGNCGWHYSDFTIDPAQILYRWTVNQLLRRHRVSYQLAKSGEDYGRLVHHPMDDRETLVARTLERTPSTDQDKVSHAVSLFRSRHATIENKRSACVALHWVLESRRALLKAELLSKDEGALFQIANQFQIRHQGADQRGDYDEAYLEWLFWWYLATIELTNQLMARNESSGG